MTTKNLLLETKVDLGEIENLYEKLNDDVLIDLTLPTKLAYGGAFGILAGLMQFVATWARRSNSKLLKTYPNDSLQNGFQNLLATPHGFVATYMAQEVADRAGTRLERRDLLSESRSLIHAMDRGNFTETLKGPGVFLTCLAGARSEYLGSLYHGNGTDSLRGSSDFLKITEALLYHCDRKFLDNLGTNRLHRISVLIRELFENTNDHASSDEDGRIYSWSNPNVRGVYAKKIRISGRQDIFNNQSAAFFLKHITRSADPQDFLEISVFDFGPGILKRVTNNQSASLNISLEEEKNFVLEAFEKGFSTKSENGTGIGLDSVVKSLSSLEAAVRLRTGRICLWQRMDRKTRKFDPIDFFPDRTKLEQCAGTTFSILIPISRSRSPKGW